MADKFSLRCYCMLDRMQAQYAAFIGTVTQGDLPTEGMASLYIEMSPGNEVFRMVDIAVKATEAKPGAQIVEREFGMFEVHSLKQAAVIEAGDVVLSRLGLKVQDRIKPMIASTQVITRVDISGSAAQSFPQGLHAGARRNHACNGMRPRGIHQLCLQRSRKESIHQDHPRFQRWPLRPNVAFGQRSGNHFRPRRGHPRVGRVGRDS